jgi:hypothetical protein
MPSIVFRCQGLPFPWVFDEVERRLSDVQPSRLTHHQAASGQLVARDGQTIQSPNVRATSASRDSSKHAQTQPRLCPARPNLPKPVPRNDPPSPHSQHHDSLVIDLGFLQSENVPFSSAGGRRTPIKLWRHQAGNGCGMSPIFPWARKSRSVPLIPRVVEGGHPRNVG